MGTVGSVQELNAGDHACVTFTDAEERLDIVAAFVHAGLRSGCKVLCLTEAITPDRLRQELANRLVPVAQPLRSGQLTIQATDDAWMTDGTPTASGMIEMLSAQVEQATRDGYPELRVSADMLWATRPLAAIEQLLIFESDVARLVEGGRLTIICQYDRDSFDPVTLAGAAEAHPSSVAAAVYHDDALLRVCRQYSPPGVRVAGEIDGDHSEALNQALTEALRLDVDVHVNLASLRFLDAANASTLVRAALSLPPDRQMVVVCAGPVRQMLLLAGANEVGQLRVEAPYDQP
jgi:anti-anti-sigma regulatory factor